MKDIQIDSDGELRCAYCGAKHFTEKRTVRAKVVGGAAGVATIGLAGAAAPLATRKKLQCKACGQYNKQGNAQPFRPVDEHAAAGVPAPHPRPKPKPEKKQYSEGENLLGSAMLTVVALIGFIWAISTGSVVWSIILGLVTAFFAIGTAAWAFPSLTEPSKRRPKPAKPTDDTPRKPIPRNGDPSFQVKKAPPEGR